jgi:UDP-glucose 4-epimerase
MKITVFGGGGFIGSAIVDRLLVGGHELRVFERPRVEPYRKFGPKEKVDWLTGDLMSAFDVARAIDGADTVIHLVSSTLPKNSNDDPIYDVQTNLVASVQMLDAMVAKGVRKIIFISSGGTVYGNPVRLPIDESHPTEPKVSYGVTKLAIEKYLLLYKHVYGLKVIILRVANPFGERQRTENSQGAVGVFLDHAISGKTINIWGDGSVTRDYLYISDVAEAFSAALDYEGENSVFNISSGAGTSLNDLVSKIEHTLGCKVLVNYQSSRTFDVQESVLDNALALSELSWRPLVGLDEGLRKTADWLIKERDK